MIRIAAVTFTNRSSGGSFQYGVSILNALQQLDPTRYAVSLWYPADHDCMAAFEKYPFEKHLFHPRFLLSRIATRVLRILNAFINNAQLARWLEKYPRFTAVQRWEPDVCIRLDQGYTPLEDTAKVIGPIHDLMHRYEPQFPEVGTAQERKWRDGFYARHIATAAAILVDSQVGALHVQECYGANPSNIFVLPFCASHLLNVEARKPESWPLRDKQAFLFYPAQLWLHKNHANLLRAIALLPPEMDVHCVFTGGADKNGNIVYKQLIKDLNLSARVHHLGYVSDAETVWLYKNAICMAMPTFFGPTNIPPLEAMQLGCPVAVSDIYGAREQLGDAAVYFAPSRPEDIAKSIALLWQDEKTRGIYRQRGRQRAEQLSPTIFEKRFLGILKKVADK